ncbi:g6990 [Coccomyxa viridis]|uniref:G6990 protein n=1 Tax=Coccomyxa viridis TaxID=1274662 RepID=A0ABP1G3B4_9CHLO
MRGPDPCKVRRALSFDLRDDTSVVSALSREPCAEAELLPVSRYCAGMYDSVVFMPCAVQTETVLSAPPAATAHMIVSNGPDDALELESAQVFGNKAMSCSCRAAVEDNLVGKLAVTGNLASLQEVTLRYMEDTGLLDLTLERAARSLNVRLAALKVHLRVLGVSKWPSRKRSSIRKLLRYCPDLQGTPKQMVHSFNQSVGELRGSLEREYRNVQCATPAKKALIRHLRQRWYRSREYRHRQETPPCGVHTPAQTTPARATGRSTEPEPRPSAII